jgi:WbqC-like protein family
MQPYFFPYIGHFALIANVDKWVVFDISQYTPRTWINRNRVLHPKSGTNWISVPLNNSSISIKIHEAKILDFEATRKSVMGKLSHYRRVAPFFSEVEEVVNEAFSSSSGNNSLVNLNVNALDRVCKYIGMNFEWSICSKMQLALSENLGPGDWALEICTSLGANCYINPVGGRSLFSPEKYERRGIDLKFLHVGEFAYSPVRYEFIPNLSIIDVLMWNSPAKVVDFINQSTSLLF